MQTANHPNSPYNSLYGQTNMMNPQTLAQEEYFSQAKEKPEKSSTHTGLIYTALVIAIIALIIAIIAVIMVLFLRSKTLNGASSNGNGDNGDNGGGSNGGEIPTFFPWRKVTPVYDSTNTTSVDSQPNTIYDVENNNGNPTINILPGPVGTSFILSVFRNANYTIESSIDYRFAYAAFDAGNDNVDYITYSSLFIQTSDGEGLVYSLASPLS